MLIHSTRYRFDFKLDCSGFTFYEAPKMDFAITSFKNNLTSAADEQFTWLNRKVFILNVGKFFDISRKNFYVSSIICVWTLNRFKYQVSTKKMLLLWTLKVCMHPATTHKRRPKSVPKQEYLIYFIYDDVRYLLASSTFSKWRYFNTSSTFLLTLYWVNKTI